MPREKPRKLTPVEDRIRRKHTKLLRPAFGTKDRGCRVLLEVDQQSFFMDGQHSVAEGNWYRRMLAIALARVALSPI